MVTSLSSRRMDRVNSIILNDVLYISIVRQMFLFFVHCTDEVRPHYHKIGWDIDPNTLFLIGLDINEG